MDGRQLYLCPLKGCLAACASIVMAYVHVGVYRPACRVRIGLQHQPGDGLRLGLASHLQGRAVEVRFYYLFI